MIKITDNDIRFVLYTAIISLVVVALMHIDAPPKHIEQAKAQRADTTPPEEREASESDIAQMRARIQPLSVLDLRQKLQPKDNKPTLLFIYTSWCPYCRTRLPELLDLKETSYLRHTRMIFFSLDKDAGKLATYLARSGHGQHFTPYIIKAGENPDLRQMLDTKGLQFSGAIPYAALWAADGRLLADSKSGQWWKVVEAIKGLEP